MSEYIKKNDAEQAILDCPISEMLDLINLQTAISNIDVIPSADVVEVVRCKDCIHNDQCKHRVVMWVEDPINTWHKDIDFCSYGERKEQEHE